MRPCLLKSLHSKSNLSPFPALVRKGASVEIDAGFFSCCVGKGMQLASDNEVQICALQSHLQNLHEIFQTFVFRWGYEHKNNEDFWSRELEAVDAWKLATLRENHCRGRGRMLLSRGRSTPSYLWLVACAAVWRFGLHVHFVSIKGKSSDNLLPVKQRDNTVLLVENMCSMLHPETVIDCETIVNYCYNTETPLWIDLVGDDACDQEIPRTDSMSTRIKQRLSVLKNKNPLSNFSRGGKEKLRAIV